jgi:hypothetical protein
MMSLFEDEPLLARVRAKRPNVAGFLQQNAQDAYRNPVTWATESGKRRRTVVEALERIYGADPPDFDAVHLYGFSRLTRKAFILYNASRLVAAGLVILDPLDRLEGGLN